MKHLLSAASFLTAFFIIVVSCNVTDSAMNGTSQLSVHLTDAPGDYGAVYVDIQYIRLKSDKADEDPKNHNIDSSGWITLNDNPIRVDLLKLRNGKTDQIGSEELDAGHYKKMRVVLGPDNEIVIGGKSYPLRIPSTQQSGIELNIDADIEDGEVYNLLIDFDVARSIIETDPNQYTLVPELRPANMEKSGSISGKIKPADIQTSIMAISGGDTLSTLSDENGEFSIIGVPPGTYRMVFKPRNTTIQSAAKSEVTVGVNEEIKLKPISLLS